MCVWGVGWGGVGGGHCAQGEAAVVNGTLSDRRDVLSALAVAGGAAGCSSCSEACTAVSSAATDAALGLQTQGWGL